MFKLQFIWVSINRVSPFSLEILKKDIQITFRTTVVDIALDYIIIYNIWEAQALIMASFQTTRNTVSLYKLYKSPKIHSKERATNCYSCSLIHFHISVEANHLTVFSTISHLQRYLNFFTNLEYQVCMLLSYYFHSFTHLSWLADATIPVAGDWANPAMRPSWAGRVMLLFSAIFHNSKDW